VKFVAAKKAMTTNFFSPFSSVAVFGFGMQHCFREYLFDFSFNLSLFFQLLSCITEALKGARENVGQDSNKKTLSSQENSFTKLLFKQKLLHCCDTRCSNFFTVFTFYQRLMQSTEVCLFCNFCLRPPGVSAVRPCSKQSHPTAWTTRLGL
jgi:hypothetical protein